MTSITLRANMYDAGAQVTVTPQTSNDGQNRENLSSESVSLSSPGTTIVKSAKIGAFMWYVFEIFNPDAAGLAVGGFNAQAVSIGRGGEAPGFGRPSFDETVHYLDRVYRGFEADPPPGGGRLIPFWPLDTIFSSTDGSYSSVMFYTPDLPTQECTQVVVSLRIESYFCSGDPAYASMQIRPQTSNDRVNWYDMSSYIVTFSPGGSYPAQQLMVIETVGTHIRFAVEFIDTSGLSNRFSSTMSIYGVGRS